MAYPGANWRNSNSHQQQQQQGIYGAPQQQWQQNPAPSWQPPPQGQGNYAQPGRYYAQNGPGYPGPQ